ncbi:MAG: ABC transporter substrate-binding protein [Chitinophagaceae bacterium]|nr:ABC transporter substrate-binding protein [Rubrivivax sp.]
MKTRQFACQSLAALSLCLAWQAHAADTCGMSNGKAATGKPIQVGAVVGKTGPEDFSSAARAAAAYFKCVNANGGINGRPVEYTVADDAWNPETAAQVATKLVKDKQVVAMVGSTSFVECGANTKMYEQEGVAVVAGVGVPRACFYSRNYAPFNQGPRLSTTAAAQYVAETHKLKSITCVAPGIPGFGDWLCGGVESWGKGAGVAVKTVLFDPGALDGNAIALQIVASKPEGVVLGMPRGMMLPILAAAEQQDLAKTIRWSMPTAAYHVDMPKAIGKYWNDRLYVHMELQPIDQDGADTKNWKAIMAKYGDKKDPIDTFSQAGHLAARAATQALMSVKGNVDRKAAFDALKAITNLRTDMLCAPWYYGNGERHNANHSGRIAVVQGNGFKTLTPCFDAKDADLADVLKSEAAGRLVN